MSPIQIVSLVLLVIAFVAAIYRHVNVGLVIIPAGFLLTLIAGFPVEKFYTLFPSKLVILILGVSFLFGHAQRSGAVDRITDLAVRGTGGRAWLLPWIMFIIAAVLSGIGALPAASLAIAVPLAMRTAVRHNINLMLMGIITIEGALAGGFSPISVWGQLVSTVTAEAGQPVSGPMLFGIEFGLNLVVAVVAFLVFGGLRLARRGRAVVPHAGCDPPDGGTVGGTTREMPERSPEGGGRISDGGAPQAVTAPVASKPAVAEQPKRLRMSVYELASLVATAAFIVVVLVVNSDVGLTAFAAGLVLQVIFRPDEKTVIRALPWSVVLVISGVLLYVGLLDKLGTLNAIAGHLQNISSISVAILAISFVGSLFASFESSSVAVLGLVVPLALQVVPGVSGVDLLLVLSAVCWSIVVVSASPYHLSGGLVLANSSDHDQTQLFRRLLLWSLAVAVAIPAVGSLVPIAMGVR